MRRVREFSSAKPDSPDRRWRCVRDRLRVSRDIQDRVRQNPRYVSTRRRSERHDVCHRRDRTQLDISDHGPHVRVYHRAGSGLQKTCRLPTCAAAPSPNPKAVVGALGTIAAAITMLPVFRVVGCPFGTSRRTGRSARRPGDPGTGAPFGGRTRNRRYAHRHAACGVSPLCPSKRGTYSPAARVEGEP
jgi:hypothetical protein